MFSPGRYIFFPLFFLRAFTAPAQETEDIVLDTMITITEVPAMEQADTITFNLVGTQVPVLVRRIPQKNIDSLKADDDYWYANAEPVKKKPKAERAENRGRNILDLQWFRDVLWFLILGSFIAIVVWYLISSNILIFRRKAKVIAADEPEAGVADDIFTINYDREIGKAVETENYRLAVRLWYLRTLKELATKGKIEYRFGRTNQDYVMQLYKSPYYPDFFRLTRNFEYTWYGQFNLSADAYEMMRNDFSTFKNALR